MALPCRWRSRPQHQKRTNAPKQTACLFYHFVRLAKQHRRHGDTECLRSLEIDEKLELCRLFYREFTSLGTFQYLVNVNSGPATDHQAIHSIRQKGPRYEGLSHKNGRW